MILPGIPFNCGKPLQSFRFWYPLTFLLIVVLPGNHFVAVLLIVIFPEIYLTVIILGSSLIVALPGSPFNQDTPMLFFCLFHSLAISLILALPRPGGSFDNN